MVLSTAYFPNVYYFSKLLHFETVYIEACENYQKQSFRNRCDILSANGVLSLSVPIQKGRSPGIRIKDAKISYETSWQKIHFKTIESAYRHAPYYEYLIDDLMFVWEKKELYLLELNKKIMQVLLEMLGVTAINMPFTEEYQAIDPGDYRDQIHPKKPFNTREFKPRPYTQVFGEKNGFQANLSILDTLFQLGPETRKYINDCVV